MVSPYCASSKDYTKNPRVTASKIRVPFMKREKASIIYLREKLNYSINELQTFTGRSTSVIHHILSKTFNPKLNLRKLPTALKLQSAQNHRLTMENFMQLWEAFILGEVDKPP
jgi:predicted transcriptional regulator